MTIKQLIANLQAFDPNLEVIVDDLSGGSYGIKSVTATETIVNIEFDSDDEDDE